MEATVIRSVKHGIEVWLVWFWQPDLGLIQREFMSERKANEAAMLLEIAYRNKQKQVVTRSN
jgi:hypothetical protein